MSDHHESHYLDRARRLIEAIEAVNEEAAHYEDVPALDMIQDELRQQAGTANDRAYGVEQRSREPE